MAKLYVSRKLLQILSQTCTDISNGSTLNHMLATSSFAPQALASTDMGYMDNLIRQGEEAENNSIEFIAHVYIMPLLLILGFISQSINIMTLNSLASAGYLYLKASAIADVLSIIALIPFCIRQGKAHNAYSYFIMFFHCHIELFLINFLITASSLCLVAMTFDRFLSIRAPITFYNTPYCRARIRMSIFCLFVVSFLVFIPSAWQTILVPHWDSKQNTVYWSIQRNRKLLTSIPFKIYLIFRECVARIGPIFILTILNIAMIQSLRRIKIRYNSRRANSTTPRVREMDRTRISVLLLITSATFVICTLPASLLSFFFDYVKNNSVEFQLFRASANCLQVSHYLYNFYLYAICSSEYRHAFLKLIGCYKPNRLYSTEGSPTIRFSTTFARVCSLRFNRLSKYGGRNKLPTTSAAI